MPELPAKQVRVLEQEAVARVWKENELGVRRSFEHGVGLLRGEHDVVVSIGCHDGLELA